MNNNVNNDIKEIANYIGFEIVPNSWRECYDKAMELMPREIEWLKLDFLDNALEFYKIKDESLKLMYINSIMEISKNDLLKRYVFLCHYILFIDKNFNYRDCWNWKATKELINKHDNLNFNVIILLSGFKSHSKNMVNRGFDKKQIEYHKEGIKNCCINDYNRFNIKGIRFSQMVWGSYFINTRLIQVGRLQYEFSDYNSKNIVKIHIPPNSPLDSVAVIESLKKSRKEIEKYFKKYSEETLYTCSSWLLSSDLPRFLDENSNIIKFQNLFQKTDEKTDKKDFLKFIFGEIFDVLDYKNLKERTKLQRRIKEHLIKGKELHVGEGYINMEFWNR
ncbi:MAG: hypothetical protein N4A47_06920 [Clostridia bacterium]|jgi:hypothetical protein|nr:hypothetical protein [Clostridia bacterium]